MRQFRDFAFLLSVVLIVAGFSGEAAGQKVRLRAQITPACASSSNDKFADVYADGNLAVMGSYNCRGAYIFDVSNPDNPSWIAWYNPGENQQFLEAIVIGNRGYFGSGNSGGVHIVDLTQPSNPSLLGIVNAANGNGFNSIHEMVVIEQNGATYLIENFNGFSNKLLKVINVTNPASPVFVRDISPTEVSWVHAMHVRGDRMFTSGWGNSTTPGRTEIYSIANLATQAPQLLGFVADTTSSAGNNMHSAWSSEDGNYLYSAREIAGSAANGPNAGDVRVYNISNPAAPLLVKKVRMIDLGLNAVTPHNPVVMGDKLYVSWYQAGVQVFDIGTDPANPVRIGQYDTYPQAFAPSEEELNSLSSLEPWDMICGSESLQNAVPTVYGGNWAVYPFLGEDKVIAGDLKTGLYILDVSKATAPGQNFVADFDGDLRTDVSVFEPATGMWHVDQSSGGGVVSTLWGEGTDRVVNGDFDGDTKSDIAVWRPSTGAWHILGSTDGYRTMVWGVNGDVPMPGDYDADGETDIAVYRPSTGIWYILQSTMGYRTYAWGGLAGDKALTGEYDGDGKSDLVVWRNGTWYIFMSSSSQAYTINWGTASDKPVMADFSGDGRADVAVFRPSTGRWYVLNSTGGSVEYHWGGADDLPIPADYDGDGKADVAVFRAASNDWYILRSSNGAFETRTFGQSGDRAVPSAVQP